MNSPASWIARAWRKLLVLLRFEVGCVLVQELYRSLAGSLGRAQPGCCQSTLTSLDVAEWLGAAGLDASGKKNGCVIAGSHTIRRRNGGCRRLAPHWCAYGAAKETRLRRGSHDTEDAIMRNASRALLSVLSWGIRLHSPLYIAFETLCAPLEEICPRQEPKRTTKRCQLATLVWVPRKCVCGWDCAAH